MKIILAEGVPKSLKAFLKDFEVIRIQELGLSGYENGRLLNSIQEVGCDVFVTIDTSLQFQQNLDNFDFNFIVVHGKTNRIEDLEIYFSRLRDLLSINLKKLTVLKEAD